MLLELRKVCGLLINDTEPHLQIDERYKLKLQEYYDELLDMDYEGEGEERLLKIIRNICDEVLMD